jgi:hypothetical protein
MDLQDMLELLSTVAGRGRLRQRERLGGWLNGTARIGAIESQFQVQSLSSKTTSTHRFPAGMAISGFKESCRLIRVCAS